MKLVNTYAGIEALPGSFLTLEQAKQLTLSGKRVAILAPEAELEVIFAAIPAKAKAGKGFGNVCIAQLRTSDDPYFNQVKCRIETTVEIANELGAHKRQNQNIWHFPGIYLPVAETRGENTGIRNEAAEKRVNIAFAALETLSASVPISR